MKHLRVASVVLLALMQLTAYSQNQDQCHWTLTGRVLDDHDGHPLEFATVFIIGTSIGTTTDLEGYFTLNGLCTGSYEIRFSHLGCEPKTRTISISGDRDIILRLEHHVELLETVELTAKRINTAGSVSRDALTVEDLEQMRGQSLGESMKALPGVNAIQTGPAIYKPVIHGLHSNRILIINDGVRQEGQQWGFDHAPEIDPFLASRLTVVKGTAAVQYGSDAVAGVILVETDSLPSHEHFAGKVGIHAMSNGWQGGISSLVEKGFANGIGVRAHATLKRSGDKRASDYNLTNTGFSEVNGSAAIGFRRGLDDIEASYSLFTTTIGILRSAHIGSLTDLEEALGRDEPFIVDDFSYDINSPKQKVVHHTIKFRGQKFYENIGILSGMYAIQLNDREEYDVRRGDRDDIPALDLRLQSHTGLLQFSHEELLGLRGKVALHWNYRNNKNVPGTGVRPLIPNYTTYIPGISLVEKWIGESFELEAGFRYEYQFLQVKRFDQKNILRKPEFNFHNFSASAGGHLALGEYFDLKTNIGYTQRAPNVNELFSEGLHHGAAAIEEGDSNLVSEKALKLVVSGEFRSQRARGQISMYTQVINDFIYLRPDGEPRLTIRGAFPVFSYVQNDAFLWGLDGAFEYDITRTISANIKYSFVRAENRDEGQPLIFMPADRLQGGLTWTGSSTPWNLGLNISHVFEQTRYPAGLDYADPPPAYTLVNVSAGYTFSIYKNELNVSIGIDNLLNTAYREYLNRLRYFADDIGRNIELRINYNF